MGRTKSKMVPVDHLPNLLAGSERYTPRGMGGLGSMNPYEDEVVAMPDANDAAGAAVGHGGSRGWPRTCPGAVASRGRCVPRSILKKQLAILPPTQGLRFNLGVETEFLCVPGGHRRDRAAGADGQERHQPTDSGLRHRVDAWMRCRSWTRWSPRCRTLGFGVFSFDHEGGDGQFEFDFAYADALQMADRITLFRLMARQIAKQCGLTATFMPKPTTGGWGSGHHYNMSLEEAWRPATTCSATPTTRVARAGARRPTRSSPAS